MKATLVLLAGYFIAVPLFLFCLIFYQSYLFHQKDSSRTVAYQIAPVAQPVVEIEQVTIPSEPDVFPAQKESLPQEPAQFEQVPEDKRVTILKTFFGRYNSPLTDYAQAIVDTADNYGLDWRLLPAIAMQESSLCKKTPKDSFNCWGFGIYGGKVTRFSDYGEAINVITKAMARDYHALGLKDPSEIVSKYTPENTNDWSGNVSYIMGRIAPSL